LIRARRVYEPAKKDDGFRILVERLWPRGLTKERVKADLWLKEIAPSDQLRKWFSHDPKKWDDFQRRYASELSTKTGLFSKIRELEREKGRITLLYSSREERCNNAVALLQMLNQ
jgi:uncharacterized protein YeaO (DUF488 family)